MKGALLAFGGSRGANIALMVEVLAAGLSGANWSLDAPSFTDGTRKSRHRPVRARASTPKLIDPGFATRLHGSSTASPSTTASTFRAARGKAGMLAKALGLDVPAEIIGRIAAFADRAAD